MPEAGAVTSLSHEEQFSHPESVGRPTPGIEVRIVDDKSKDVNVGALGEMLVRSEEPGAFTIMKGYLNWPKEAAKALCDGWLYTGDLAYRDDQSYLYIVDRKKGMILSGEFNIYSKEVEGALASHNDVADVAVAGVDDDIYGEAVAAFVECEAGVGLSAGALIVHFRATIALYKKPNYVVFVDTLPRNAIGKVLKHQLSGLAPEDLRKLMRNVS